jgi:hypothetical protein
MKLRQLFENFVISNDEFEDYLNRTTEQLASEIQSGKNARDAIHDLSLQFSKMHNNAYAAYQRMSDALTSRMYVLDLNAQSSEPAMGGDMGGFDDLGGGIGDEFGGDDMGGDLGGEMGDEFGGDVEQLNDPMGGGMQMDLPMGDEMPSDNDMTDYNAVMGNKSMGDEDTIGESKIKEAGKMKGGAKDPCWSGYKMVGTKKKGSKEVPNCVPESKIDESNIVERIKRLQDAIEKKSKSRNKSKEHLDEFLPALGTAATAVRGAAMAAKPAITNAVKGTVKAMTSPTAMQGAKTLGNAVASGAKGLNTGMQKVKSYMDKQTSSNQGIQPRFPSGGATKESMYEETYEGNEFYEAYGDLWFNEDTQLDEAEYQGRKVPLGKPMRGDVKKFKVYVKDPSTGNVKKVNFGDPDMKIKKSNPERRKSFRARHNCDNPGPRTKARYWSCRKW